jgi:exosome complex RNA-binding protein Csl4
VDAAETTNYNPATKTVHINVDKADQTITWSDPGNIVYGTVLGVGQLNATVAGVPGGSAPGALTYTPGAGTLLDAGNGQALKVDAAETTNYNPATKTVHINVDKATPTVHWTNPADIVYGTALNGTQLNATFTWIVNGSTVTVAGTATYTPPSGTVLFPGANQNLKVDFAPTNTTNYNSATKTVQINVTYGTCSGSTPGGVILQPINADNTSVFPKAGRTVPVKFTLCNANGDPIFDPNAVFATGYGSITLINTVRGTVTLVDENGAYDIPDTAFRYSNGIWIFNMATSNLSSGNTYTFRINLKAKPTPTALGPYIEFRIGIK